jgi:hypothetical protein
MATATLVVSLLVADAHSRRWKGAALIGVYLITAGAYWIAGDP